MFKIIERFFRGFVNQTPVAWQSEDEDVKSTDFGVDTIKQNLYQFFDRGWEKMIRCDDGWINIISECHNELIAIDKNYSIQQIKQKFGTLRYYCTPSNPKHEEQFAKIVDKYERLSIKVCEISGTGGVLMKKDGWFKTLNPTLGKTLGYEKCKVNQ
jgi:hypothetical protein